MWIIFYQRKLNAAGVSYNSTFIFKTTRQKWNSLYQKETVNLNKFSTSCVSSIMPQATSSIVMALTVHANKFKLHSCNSISDSDSLWKFYLSDMTLVIFKISSKNQEVKYFQLFLILQFFIYILPPALHFRSNLNFNNSRHYSENQYLAFFMISQLLRHITDVMYHTKIKGLLCRHIICDVTHQIDVWLWRHMNRCNVTDQDTEYITIIGNILISEWIGVSYQRHTRKLSLPL